MKFSYQSEIIGNCKTNAIPHGASQDLRKIAPGHVNIIFRWHFRCYNIHHQIHLPEQPSKQRNRADQEFSDFAILNPHHKSEK